MRRELAGRLLAGLLALNLLVPLPAPSQTPATASSGQEAGSSVGAWPRQIQAGETIIEVYQPQIDSWQGNRLEARAALSVKSAGSPALSYGVIWITARTDVDKSQGLVTLGDIKVPRRASPGSRRRRPTSCDSSASTFPPA